MDFYIKYEVGQDDIRPGWIHYHKFNELVLVCSGKSQIIFTGMTSFAEGRYVIFYPAYIPHSQINSPDVEYARYYIRFSTNIFSDGPVKSNYFPEFFGNVKQFTAPLSDGAAENAVRYITEFYKLDAPGVYSAENADVREKLTLALLLNELREELKNSPAADTPFTPPAYVYEAASFIDSNVQQKLTIDMLAETFFVSRSKLTRDFRAAFSMTVNEYILLTRFIHARRLLSEGLGLAEIAERCGFSDASYFIASFKKTFGVTPSEYRRVRVRRP